MDLKGLVYERANGGAELQCERQAILLCNRLGGTDYCLKRGADCRLKC